MANFVVLCDYPAFDDPEKALKDNMGRYTWHLLKCANAPTGDIAIEFLYDTKADMKYGRSRWRDIEARHKPRVVVAMGQQVFKDLELDGFVSKCRGSVFTIDRRRGPMYVVPTFSPREMKKPYKMYAEEPMEKGIYSLHDFQRAVTVYRNGWEVPEERFNLDPTVEEVESFVNEAIANQWLLGCDLEGDGLNIEHTNIVVAGFAWSESDAIVIPLLTTDKQEYYKGSDRNRVSNALKRLYREGRFMFQNGVGYDVPLLRARGWQFPIENLTLDTMVEHHAINPESPHNIGFISSIYGKQPYWKDVIKLYLGNSIYDHPDIPGQTADGTQQGMRLYNARDCVALHQIHNGMQDYIKQLEAHDPVFKSTNKIIEKSMEEARACVYMEETGLLLDKRKLREWVKYLQTEIESVETRIRTKHNLPDAFSLTSPDHKRMWIYDEKIAKLDREHLQSEIDRYDHDVYNYQYECSHCGRKKVQKFQPDLEDVPGSISVKCSGKGGCGRERRHSRTDKEPSLLKRKSKDTDVYRTLLGNWELSTVDPLPQLRRYKPLQTEKEKSALDKDAMVRLQIHIGARLDDIANLRRRTTSHDEEERDLKDLSATIELLKTYVKYKKLQDSFVNFAPRANGRIYPHFMVTGTATGRLSCKSPNA